LRAAGRPARKLAGSIAIASRVVCQRRIPSLPEEKLLELRDRNVRAIVRVVGVGYPGNATELVRRQLREWAYVPGRDGRETLSLFEPFEHLVADINRARPTLLIAYGSFVELLFGTARARGLPLHVPAAVLYVSDHLTDHGRRLRDDFGVAVLSNYSAVEALRIGFGCLACGGFHLHADLTHVRIVDAAGADVPAGQTGEVVVSNLVNRGTVLLNYRLGDEGSLAAEPGCECGRTLPRLATLEGRRDDVIELAGGRHVHSAEVWSHVRGNEELIQYQLVQLAHERFELRVAATDRAMFDRVASDLVRRLRPLLGETAVIEPAYVDAFAPYGREKRRQVISYVTRPGQRPQGGGDGTGA
jgi:phenylacetate-CoA ligase